MKRKLKVVICPSMKCEECSEFSHDGCWTQITDDNLQEDIAIFDSEKYILHIIKDEITEGIESPTTGTGWESVFLGKNSRVSHQIHDLAGIARVGPYFMMFLKCISEEGFVCIPIPRVRSALELSLLENLSRERDMLVDQEVSLREDVDEQMSRVTQAALKKIMVMIPELSRNKAKVISEIIGHQATVFGLLIPFLLMEETEEIFLDRPGSMVYFDHQNFGRCQTLITIEGDDISKFITLIRSETNLHLDRSNPSLKADMRLIGVPLRVSVSIAPLSPDGFHLEIRRARYTPFSLKDLIDNGTISREASAILLLALASRFNITITGGPGTGKTTLLNALDMATPTWWRKVYIEDASESRIIDGHHQVRLTVDPIDEQIRRSTKEEEIVKSLHRSPDYLILGEIQTKQHSIALFQAIAAGLKVMQTCHSDSAAGLVSRWNIAHRIAESSIGQMDLIVTLERPRPGESKRVVSEIVEICRKYENGLARFSGLNQIYSIQNGITDRWSSSGTFVRLAKVLGLESHLPALESLIAYMDDVSNRNPENLPSLLWNASHPIAYSYSH